MSTKTILQKALVLFALLIIMPNAYCYWWNVNADRKLGYWQANYTGYPNIYFTCVDDVISGRLDTVPNNQFYDGAYDFGRIYRNIDTTYTSPDALYLTSDNNEVILGSSFPMYKLSGDSITIDVKIGYKEIVENCDSTFSIILNMIGAHAKIIQADTISLPVNTKWTEVTRSVTMQRGLYLEARFEVVSKHRRIPMMAFTIPEFSSGGKPLERLVWNDDGEKCAKVSPEAIQSFDGLLSSPLMDKKILALGETLHGSQTVNDTVFGIMKERILHHNCRLLLFEISTEECLYYNRYIKNDTRYSIDTISKYYQPHIMFGMTDFLQWLKDYNAAHNNEVTLFGVDIGYKYILYDFFAPLNYDFRLDSLCYDLLCYKGDVDKDVVKQRITPQELAIIKHRISIYSNTKYHNYIPRDLLMVEMIQLACNEYLAVGETATFYSHFAHSHYLYDRPTGTKVKSAGNYLKEMYKDDYSCVAIAVETGIRSAYRPQLKCLVHLAPKGSFEDIMSGRPSDAPIFISMDSFNYGDICKIRHAALEDRWFNDFELIEPKANMDGIVVLKRSQPLSLKGVVFTPAESFMYNRYYKAMIHIEERLQAKEKQ